MAARLTAALVMGALSLLLSVSRHAVAIAAHLEVTRGVSMQEMAFLSRVFGLVSFVLLFVLPFAAGYLLDTQIEFRREYPSLAAAYGLGGGLGYLVGMAVIVPTATVAPGLLATAFLVLAAAIAVGVEIAIVGFAGGALAHLRSPNRPVV